MLEIIGWLLMCGYLFNKGNTVWGHIVLWGGVFLMICGAIGERNEAINARANRQHYWAHYYDRDQVEARRRAGQDGRRY